MQWTYAKPLTTYYAAFIDPVKSVPHQLPGGIENMKGLPFWIPTQEYLVNYDKYLEKVGELDLVEHIVYDPFLEKPLVKFFTVNGKSGVWDKKHPESGNGMLALQFSKYLTAYRMRQDGLLGLESLSGMVDTRLSLAEALKKPEMFPANVKRTNKIQANFSSENGEFSPTRVEKEAKE